MVMPSLLRQPLLHFLAIGAAIFLLSAALDDEPAQPPVVVTEGRVEQLAEAFRRTWQRPPTVEELRGLVADFVREEIYYREAVLLGLDRDDTIVRRRMRQKMEFLATLQAEEAVATEEDLAAFHRNHPELFREPAQLAFRQVFVNPELHGEAAEAEALRLLEALRQLQDPERAPELGDSTLLPVELPLGPLDAVGRSFGESFAEALAVAPVGIWDGPVASAYGLHLVLVLERRDGRLPPLEEVRAAVEYQWRRDLERRVMEERYEALARKYRVVLEVAE
ncbi:MAG TPA: peptidylprolyl isomerase [Kiloniellales bacterium]|nr:peptidylprolyl isomerase [Kiloniellales bacterium]